MSAEYDLYENPVPPGSNKKPRMHARIVTRGTVETHDLAEWIHTCSTLTVGDINAVLTELSRNMLNRLKDGDRIHLAGFGYFQMTLSCPPIRRGEKIRAESIKFKSIAFRPEAEVKHALSDTRFERVRLKSHSSRYSEIEIDGLLTGHFLDNPSITRMEFEMLCNLTKATANRRLAALVKAGKLRKAGLSRFPVYEPVPGNYRH